MYETVLIVDDEERIRKLIAAYLKKEEYTVIEASDGIEALKLFNQNKIDIIVLDVMMPAMDGWTVCRKIRKTSNVPIIMLTAKSEEDDEILGFELGADNYVTKPFSPRVLTAKIKSLLKKADLLIKNDSEENNYDGLKIDELSHNVTLDGKDVYLSPKEFELLLYFTLNKGIVVSREKLLDNVWGMDYYGDLRTVDTHVKRLREKLGDRAYLIGTVRGSGYKFDAKNENKK